MIKAVLLDDELHCTKTLEILLKSHCPQVQIQKIFNHPLEAIEYLKSNSIDVLFLDIEMPFLNGFDLLDRLKPFDFKVIFTTAYDKFAIKAFKFSAFDYILKPIDEEELVEAVSLLEQKVSGNEQLQMLMDIMSSQSKKVNKIALPTSEGLEFVNIAEIIRCESDSNYTKIILDGLPYIIVSKTLKEMTDLLGELDFVRVHNSHLINPTHISKYIKAGGGALILTDNVEIPISRQKKDNIMELIKAIK